MVLIISELLLALGFVLHGIGVAANGIGHLIDAISNATWLHVAWGAMIDWFRAAPTMQMAPQLSLENEALYTQFQHLMDTRFEIGELRRTFLTLPALPDEGY